MRVVGLRLEAGQNVPEHRNAIPVALIVTEGRLHFDDGTKSGEVSVGEMLLINPGERHIYRADIDTSAYLPRYYPPQLVHYLKTYGQAKVLFGTNLLQLSFSKCVQQVQAMNLAGEIQEKFLSGNARRVFQLD